MRSKIKIGLVLGIVSWLVIQENLASPLMATRVKAAVDWQTKQADKPTAKPAQPAVLKSGNATLNGGEKHSFRIALKANDYLNLMVDQQGIDVVVRLLGPNGKVVQEVDSPNGTFGPEPISLIVEKGGTYGLEIESPDTKARAGKYEVKLDPVRTATEQDRAGLQFARLNLEFQTLFRAAKYDQALPIAQKQLEIAEKVFGLESEPFAKSLHYLGKVFFAKGDFAQAESWYGRALPVAEKVFGNESLKVVPYVKSLADVYLSIEKYDTAEPLFQRCLSISEKTVGENHPEVADILASFAVVYFRKADYAKAEPMMQRALEINEKTLGDHQNTSYSLLSLAVLNHMRGNYDKAESLYQRCLTMMGKVLDPDHPYIMQSLGSLAVLYMQKGNYKAAEPIFLQVSAVEERVLGPNHPQHAITLTNLGHLYQTMADYGRAEPYFRQALAINEKTFGPNHPTVATNLNQLAQLNQQKGVYPKAEELFQRALAINEKAYGPLHPEVAVLLTNLGVLYQEISDYPKAEPLYQRALAILEKALGPEHPNVAANLVNQGTLYFHKGDLDQSETCYRRALAISEKKFGPHHPEVGRTLGNIALILAKKGEYTAAQSLQEQALAIREKALGPDHPEIAISCKYLGELFTATRKLEQAEAMFTRALAIYEKKYGANHPTVAQICVILGDLYRIKGDFTRAEAFSQKSLAIREQIFGPGHNETVFTLNVMSLVKQLSGNIDQAIDYRVRCSEGSERNLTRNLVVGSERQKVLFLNRTAESADTTLSLHLQSAPQNQIAAKTALTEVLRRKGRALEVMTSTIATLRAQSDPETQKLLDDYTSLTNQVSVLTLRGPEKTKSEDYQAYLKQLETQQEKLENDISRRSIEFAVQTKPVTVDAVQSLIPADAALVEFAVYRPLNLQTQKYEPAHYGVYVLTSQGVIRSVDLGETVPIDTAIAQLRQVLRNSRIALGNLRSLVKVKGSAQPVATVMAEAREVDRLVMEPVRKLLGDKRHLLISPDGDLNLIPFAALVTESGKFLVEDYLMTYVTSGRDLLRMQTKLPSQQPPMVVANPDYAVGTGPVLAGKSVTPLVSLPGTGREGLAIQKLFGNTRLVTQAEATKEVVQSVHRPELLHIATHGYFLQDVSPVLPPEVEPSQEQTRAVNLEKLKIENPLLRSFLFFAGANRGEEQLNGTLTALEASQLDLWGTKLVVLSACETGLGEVKNGNGVYGLRRALVLAGSESQMMSLWSVSDVGTRDLMVGYYTRLKAGEGRSEALRNTQLKMLKDPRRRHPFYWASFIQSGEWKKL